MNHADFDLLNVSTLRIYLHHNQRVPAETIWERLLGKNLAHAILKEAKKASLSQAIQYPIRAGFLRDSQLVFDHSDVKPDQLPVCIELVDEPHRLKSFLYEHQTLLKDTQLILENAQTYQLIHKFSDKE